MLFKPIIFYNHKSEKILNFNIIAILKRFFRNRSYMIAPQEQIIHASEKRGIDRFFK